MWVIVTHMASLFSFELILLDCKLVHGIKIRFITNSICGWYGNITVFRDDFRRNDIFFPIAGGTSSIAWQNEVRNVVKAMLWARPIPDSNIPPHQTGMPRSMQ